MCSSKQKQNGKLVKVVEECEKRGTIFMSHAITR